MQYAALLREVIWQSLGFDPYSSVVINEEPTEHDVLLHYICQAQLHCGRLAFSNNCLSN